MIDFLLDACTGFVFRYTYLRMVFWELLKIFLMALVGLTSLFVIAGVIQQANQYGLNLAQILTVIPLTVPTSFPYTIPATTLFATCVAYGRLSHDNEAVVLKAAGVNLYLLLMPALLLGLLTAAFTAAVSHTIIPLCWREIQEEAIRDPEETIYNILRRERMFKSANSQWVLYVRDVQGRRLIDVVLKQKKKGSTDGVYDVIARTRQARLVVNTDANKLKIEDDESENSWTMIGSSTEADIHNSKPEEVDLPPEYRKDRLRELVAGRPQAIDWPDLPAKANEWFTGPDGTERALRIRGALLSVPPNVTLTAADIARVAGEHGIEPSRIPADANERAKQAQHYADVAEFTTRSGRTLELEWLMRPALAFGCVVFALIGCPVGMWANRGDYLSIFVVCFLPTLFSYYPVLLSGSGLARDGKVPMFAGVWAANAFGLLGGLILTWRLVKR